MTFPPSSSMLCVLPFCLSFPPCLLPPHLLPVFLLPFLLQTFPSFFLFCPLFPVLCPFMRSPLAKKPQDLQEDDLGSSQPRAGFMRLEQSSHLPASQPPPLQSEGDGGSAVLGTWGQAVGTSSWKPLSIGCLGLQASLSLLPPPFATAAMGGETG